MTATIWLGLAIAAEVIATVMLKSTHNFTRALPSAVVVIGYASAFYFLSFALRTIPVGIAYAVWSGIGMVLVAGLAWIIYGQRLHASSFVGIGFIIVGALILHLRMPRI
jgi:small multidrug resistance pump